MCLFLLGKVKNNKYLQAETCHPENIDGWSYYRLCENFWWPFGSAPGGNLDSTWAQLFFILLLNLTRTLWFFWDVRLTLFDILKDVVFVEILGFSNIFHFLAVNWVWNGPKPETLGAFHLSQNSKFWRIFQTNAVFVLLETTSGQNFSMIKQHSGSKGPKKSNKESFHGCWINMKKVENF